MNSFGSLPLLREVLIGQAVPFARPGVKSAIAKFSVAHAITLETHGLVGDAQGDRSIHGGLDKAVHGYAWSHYAAWQDELPDTRMFDKAGGFGENFSIVGSNESSVCIGDRWRVGTAILEISQGRQPCWKLNHRFAINDMAVRVQQSLRSGWYYRVLQPGIVIAGDQMELLDRPCQAWSIARLLAIIRDRECNIDLLNDVLRLPLTPSWRKLFLRRIEIQYAENWQNRMYNDG
jgi:MOSC domain-containing protein YiiM